MSQVDIEPIEHEEFPGYGFSPDGSIYSRWVRGRWKRIGTTWTKLKTPPDNHGYKQVNIYYQNGVRKHFKVHLLMLYVFVGPKPDGMMTRHLNGDRSDNRIVNLAYGTAAENGADARLHGTTNRGVRCPCSKLNDREIVEIRKRARQGEMQKTLASKFRVSNATICEIVNKKTWVHVLDE